MGLTRLRPREGWRVFAGEVGVIVLGVLIALGAQQLADDWQWRQTIARTKADLDDQVRRNVAVMAERAAVDRCLAQRLATLAAKVAASRGQWTGDPYQPPGEKSTKGVVQYAVRVAYRMPSRNFPGDVWDQAKASDQLSHMAPADIARYGQLFAMIEELREDNLAEFDLAPQLSFLAFDGPLSPSDRARALSTISALDWLNRNVIYNLEKIAAETAKMDGHLSSGDEAVLFDNLNSQSEFRGPCVDRAAALRLVAPLRAPGAIRTR